MQAKKIAIIKKGNFSHLNEYILKALYKTFPDYKIEVFDVKEDLLNPGNYFLNYFYIIKEYGREIILSNKKFRKCTFRTTYLFQKIKEAVAEKISKNGYCFTLQTQSFFDASIEGTPHFVYTDHTHLANLYYSNFDPKNLFSEAWRGLETTIYKNANIVFTMSSNISRSLIEQYECPPDKVKCIYAGYNLERKNIQVNDEKYKSKNILFVGIDWDRKGGPTVVEAFRNILKVHPDAHLYIVGCSPDIDCPNCVIVGKIPIDQVAAYYQKSAIFCLPTTLEPFGVVFLEAAAYKLPVVATHVGAIPDFVKEGENGFLVSPYDSTALAQKLIELLNSPQKCQLMGANNFTRNLHIYNWDSVAKKFRDHVEAILS